MAIKENPIIQVKHLSKKYRIGMDRTYKTFSESAVNLLKSPLKTIKNIRKHNDIFWALKDINFEVNRGEILGIIGRNGAGKTTLLKILTRITHITEGEVILRGRVGSLLEVGTGFHMELTGRENIYFNGAILGMKIQEIKNKFDEIVEFSGVKKFLDTPLKRYSSGMQVRLAFSVAAHLEPEILLIDEVLAVGDMEFQKKCLGKMGEVAEGGRTVLFVSHNLGAIDTLCNRTILLDHGRIVANDTTKKVINKYLSSNSSIKLDVKFNEKNVGDNHARILRVRFINEDRNIPDNLVVDKIIGIEITYQIMTTDYKPGPNFLISTQGGTRVFQSLETCNDNIFKKGKYRSIAWIPANLLNDENYILTVALTTHNPVKVHCQTELLFDVYDNINAITRGDYKLKMYGVMRPYLVWETDKYDIE